MRCNVRLAPGEPRRILVRGVNWLGDAVMTTPALVRLRERYPGAVITLLTPAKLADLWTAHPAVDVIMTFEPAEGLRHVGRRLRALGFDLGLALPNSHRSALELWLARIPRRVGLAALFRSWCFTDPVAPRTAATRMRKPSVAEIRRARMAGQARSSPPPEAHHLHQYLHLVAALGADPTPLPPRLHVTPEEVRVARDRFNLTETTRWLALSPGAEYGSAKRWPVARFVEAAVELQRRGEGRWIVFGGAGDLDVANEVARGIEQALPPALRPAAPVQLAGRTTLRGLCAVLRACRILLTNDSGPMHVAAALEVPVVALFGSTSPELTGPGLPGDPNHRIVRRPVGCAPCFRRTCPVDLACLEGIPAAIVVERLNDLLTASGPAR